jgi:hypothetical protein
MRRIIEEIDMTETPAQDTKRLPCRGCTSDCKNYEFCDGNLWRQAPADVHKQQTTQNK